MAEKIVIVTDPGIDGAFSVALALHDPELDVLALAATAGNVSATQATHNIHVLIEQTDPPRWPRLGEALPIDYEINGQQLHGPDGLGGVGYPCSRLRDMLPSDKLLVDMVRQYPKEVTIVCLGPLTAVAAAVDRDPDLPLQVKRIVCVGGSINEPGNAGPVSEFHFVCDPLAARQILRSGAPLTLIPLDILRQVLFSPTDLLDLPAPDSRTCQFLSSIVPFAIGASSNIYGIEGFHLKDVLGIAAVALPEVLSLKPMIMDVETRGELTRGMSVVDRRLGRKSFPNVDVAVHVEIQAIRAYIDRVLRLAK